MLRRMLQAVLICTVLEMQDGDSGRCGGVPIRLAGIDAPETALFTRCRQRPTEWACLPVSRAWGKAATYRTRLLAQRGARGAVVDRDQYRRVVVRCEAEERDLGAALVREGFAMSASAYGDPYRAEEQAAWAERLGIWTGR